MKKPTRIKIKEARYSDRALQSTAFWLVLLAVLRFVLLKKFDAASQTIQACTRLATVIVAIFIVVSLLTKVRPIKVAYSGKKYAMIAVAFWQAPNLFNNFEGEWEFVPANLIPLIIAEIGVCFCFWLFTDMILSKK